MAARPLRFAIALALAGLTLLGLSLSAPRTDADTATHAFPIRGIHSYGGVVLDLVPPPPGWVVAED